MFKALLKQLTRPLNLAILNGILIAVLISMNIYFQAFCIPSGWAIGLLSLCFITTIVYPLPQLNRYAAITGFINGLSLITFLYCIIFLGYMNLLGLLLVPAGIGLVVFIPHFFVLQLFWKNTIKPHSSASRPYFLLAISICLFVVLCIGKAYQKAILSVQHVPSLCSRA